MLDVGCRIATCDTELPGMGTLGLGHMHNCISMQSWLYTTATATAMRQATPHAVSCGAHDQSIDYWLDEF